MYQSYHAWKLNSIDPAQKVRFVAMVPSLRKHMSILLLVPALFSLSGCAHLGSEPRPFLASLRASYRAGAPVVRPNIHQQDYWNGWRAGYYEIASGGQGLLPAIPPRRYWNTTGHPNQRQCQIDEWYRGFTSGVAAADGDGLRDAYTIPGRSLGCTELAAVDPANSDFESEQSVNSRSAPESVSLLTTSIQAASRNAEIPSVKKQSSDRVICEEIPTAKEQSSDRVVCTEIPPVKKQSSVRVVCAEVPSAKVQSSDRVICADSTVSSSTQPAVEAPTALAASPPKSTLRLTPRLRQRPPASEPSSGVLAEVRKKYLEPTGDLD